MIMERFEIDNGVLHAAFSACGAELLSLCDAQGIERIWPGDAAYWSGHAPVLFPVAGALRDDAYMLSGRRYSMPKHGFSSNMHWHMEEHTQDSITFLLAEKHAGFPFDYALRACYRLQDHQLQIEYRVENHDAQPFYYSLGAHEAYYLPEGLENYHLLFDEPEAFAHTLLEGSLTTHQTVTCAPNGRVFPLRKRDFETYGSFVFENLSSRGVTLQSNLHARSVHVAYPDFPVLLLWTVPGANYICIEPWHNAPDRIDSDGEISHKPGMICLRPGEKRSLLHTLTFA